MFTRVYRAIEDIAMVVYNAAREVDSWPSPFYYLAPLLFDLGNLFDELAYNIYLVDLWSQDLEDKLQDTWYRAVDAWNYAYGWLTDRVNTTYNATIAAVQYAMEALDLAEAALTEIPSWILDKLTLAYNLASTALQTVPAWIRAGLDSVNSSLTSLWDYARTTVYNKAVDAWNKAANAWDYARYTVWPAVQDLGTDLGSLWDYARTTVYNKAVDAWNKAAAAFSYAESLIDSLNATLRSWVIDMIKDIETFDFSIIAAPINLINTWFDAIQDFFNDPLEWLWGKFTDWFLGPEK